jgi:hypothetical protein
MARMEQILYSYYLNFLKHYHSLFNCFINQRQTNLLHGKPALVVLNVQDIEVVLIMIVITAFSTNEQSSLNKEL